MYCKLRNRECPSAGEVVIEEGTKEVITVCYRVGGRTACT